MKENIKSDELLAKYIAIIIRNELEDFHIENIPDSKMKELNTAIRNGVFTAIHTLRNLDDPKVTKYYEWNMQIIPDYWESPILTKDYEDYILSKEKE